MSTEAEYPCGAKMGDDDAVRTTVSKYYGETLQTSSDLLTSACCTAKAPPKEVRDVLSKVPHEIISKYYGCGSPFPAGISGSGLRVLDLGCGSGRDCYVCAALVGPKGFVTGIDMTPQQLEVAERHNAAWQQQLGYQEPNMKFVQGQIEKLSAAGIAASSVDLIISNCVVNLSPDKAAVLQEAYKALAPGGELYFSDVYCDRRLSAEVRHHEVLLGECLGGALYVNDFLHLAQQVGFADPRVLEVETISVNDTELQQLVAGVSFFSITFRLFKLAAGQLEQLPEEDYGQTATYKGTLVGAANSYVLDYLNTFPTGVPVHVSGNTAAMLSASWLAPHFSVTGDKTVHLGQFGSGSSSSNSHGTKVAELNAAAVAAMAAAAPSGGSSCCPPGTATTTPAATAAAAAAGKSCCGPKPPAPAANRSCCGPAPAASCCGPAPGASAAAPVVAKEAGCCGPSKGGNSCCPAPASQSKSCCPAPSAAAAADAAAPAAQAKQGGCSGGKCC